MIKQKLKNSSGETLAETLVATMVMALAMTMLAGAIVASAGVNARAKKLSTAFVEASDKVGESPTVTITHNGSSFTEEVDVYVSSGSNQYVYYKLP